LHRAIWPGLSSQILLTKNQENTMSTTREKTIPAQTTSETIRQIEELLPYAVPLPDGLAGPLSPGRVVVMVSTSTEGHAEQFNSFTISGADYDDLVSEAPEWAPDKPAGTYRNADLWHFIDLQRAALKPE
jgi:hypothetical protein